MSIADSTASQNPARQTPPVAAPAIGVVDWGRTTYADALARQETLQAERVAGRASDTLVITEHEAVFTVGMRSGSEKHLLWDAASLAREGVTVHPTNRGGDITYHGPGQLVAYPIVSLEARRDLHAYLRFLEDVLIATVARHSIIAGRRDGLTGIWVEDRKLAAIGVSVRRWVTMHGVALNVAPDLRHFGGIVPCGISASEGTVTSLAAELGAQCPSLARVAQDFATEFSTRWPAFANPEH